MQLFRQQVLDNRRPRLEGEIVLLPRLSHSALLACLLAWLTACGLWLVNSEFTRKESVRGWLAPRGGVIRVYPGQQGLVKRLLVSAGDTVREGQPLMIINGDSTLASGEQLESLLLQEFQHQQQTLQQQLLRNRARLDHRRQQLGRELATTRESLALTDQELATLDQRQRLLANAVERYRDLAQAGHLAHAELDDAQRRQLALVSTRQALLRTRTGLQQRLQTLQTERHLLPAEHEDQVDNLQLRLSDIAQRMAQQRGKRARVINAPGDGRVDNLQVVEGQQTLPGVPLLAIVPPGKQLQAQLLVPVRAAGFITAGQQLKLRYDAFPYQKFGLFPGIIEVVSNSVQLPGEIRDAPIASNEATYRVSARLLEQRISAYGQQLALRPGMTFSADIKLGTRTLWEWLLDPLYSLRGRL